MMTNEQKAKEIAAEYCEYYDGSKEADSTSYNSAMEMARYKDAQSISELGGWTTEPPAEDGCYLAEAKYIPYKNSCFLVAEYDTKMRNFLLKYAPFKVGEVVAIAQSYFDIKTSANSYRPPIWEGYKDWHEYLESLPTNGGGYYNKMFVRAELMPHKIEITGIQVQRLQDISNDDCLAEGIMRFPDGFTGDIVYSFQGCGYNFDYPITAYSELIDRISGKGTWERNPWAFCYTFKLVE